MDGRMRLLVLAGLCLAASVPTTSQLPEGFKVMGGQVSSF